MGIGGVRGGVRGFRVGSGPMNGGVRVGGGDLEVSSRSHICTRLAAASMCVSVCVCVFSFPNEK